ncbi:MAG: DNA polymerase III subunit beta [Acidobacteria bacterium]|nr:MAG: DNA polymerase III subunit beta [Acidobacteriota bacterium]
MPSSKSGGSDLEIQVSKQSFFKELQLLQGIIERKNTMPILANLLLTASKGSVELTASDLEVALRIQAEADVKQSGSATLPAKKIFEIVRELPDLSTVSLKKLDNNFVEIRCGSSYFKLPGMPVEEYPSLPEVGGEKTVTLPAAVLKEMIRRVIFSIAQEDIRYAMNGALFLVEGNRLLLVGTDGHRLAYVSTELEGKKVPEKIEVIISKKALGELMKLLPEAKEEVQFGRFENFLFFRVDSRLLLSRNIEAQFPNYDKFISLKNDKMAAFNSVSLMKTIKRVAVVSNERSRAVEFSLSGGMAKLSSANPEMAEGSDSVEIQYDGGPLKIGFNSQYLIDFLGAISAEEVTFELQTESTAALIRPKGTDQYDYRYVLMPMRL